MSGLRMAVVGAGIAGLSAARRLAQVGVDVVVFEKARRPGGRLATRRAAGFAFDHGAQYFTCRSPAFEPLVSRWCATGVAAIWDAPITALEAGARTEAHGDTRRYVGVPGMSALARDLAADLGIECEHRIGRVLRSKEGWRLVAEDGRASEDFDGVVIATPAPQAARLLEPLPELSRRLAAVTMQSCHALMVAFSKPLEVGFGGAFVAESPLSWVGRNASKPGRGDVECWVLHTTPEWSEAHLDESPDAIGAAMLEAFAAALGRELPPVLFRTAHLWRFARTDRPLGDPFLWDPAVGLGACGDWCFGGRVESAFLSGDGLARAVLDGPPDPAAHRGGRRSPAHAA